MIGDLRFRVRRAWGLGGPSKMKGRPRFDRAWARVACPCTNATRGSPSCMHVEGSRLPTTAMKGLPSIDHGQGSLYLARSIGSLRFSDLPLGLGPATFKIRPRRAGFLLPAPGTFLVFIGGVDDFSPGLEGRVGDYIVWAT